LHALAQGLDQRPIHKPAHDERSLPGTASLAVEDGTGGHEQDVIPGQTEQAPDAIRGGFPAQQRSVGLEVALQAVRQPGVVPAVGIEALRPDDVALGVEKGDDGQTQGGDGAFVEIGLDVILHPAAHEIDGIVPDGPVDQRVVELGQLVIHRVSDAQHVPPGEHGFQLHKTALHDDGLEQPEAGKKDDRAETDAP